MPAKINLIGQKFGKLLVIEETDKRKDKSVVWKCKCECGNIEEFSTKQLRSEGLIMCHSCGNKRSPRTNLLPNIIGQKFNRLTVLEKTEKRSGGKICYKCQCDCGNIVYVPRTDLISGHTVSCGCSRLKYKKGDIINNRLILDDHTDIRGLKVHKYTCKCLLCGNIYDVSSTGLDKTISCGCQKSVGEFRITQILREANILFRTQYMFPNSNYRFDFAILKEDKPIRLIEFDGEQHYEGKVKHSGWNTYEKYEHTLRCDLGKNELAKENNIPLVRIPYWERENLSLDLLLSDKYLIS